MVRLRPLLALCTALLVSVALVACGGEDKDGEDAAASSSAGAGVTRGEELTRINLAESTAKIGDLKSFRFELNASIDFDLPDATTMDMDDEDALGNAFAALLLGSLKDVKVEGAFVAPDQFQVNMSVAGQDFGLVKIADKAWIQQGGVWTPVESDELAFSFDDFDLGELSGGMLPQELVEAAKVTREKLGGVDTTRYSFDKAAIEKLAEDSSIGEEIDSAQLDLWLTDEGIPLKVLADFAGHDSEGNKSAIKFDLELKDINSDIQIKAPM
jgi:hypothetical protein